MKYIINIFLYLNKHLDKVAHVFFGLILSFCIYMVIRSYTITFIIVGASAYLKQMFDLYYGSKRMDLYDFMATLFGGILGLLMWTVK